MRSECFLDTNIVIYAAAGRIDEPRKHQIALELLRTKLCGLSGQVLAEFYAQSVLKFSESLRLDELDEWLDMLSRFPVAPIDADIVRHGVALGRRYRISYWDGAILAAA